MSREQKLSSSVLRRQVRAAVRAERLDEIEELLAADTRPLRHLVGMSYDPDEKIRKTAARAVGLAAKYHPELIQSTIRRLIWAMNEESGANALAAPYVLEQIARVDASLLLPMVPDLVRLSGDDNLHDGIADAMCVVVHSCPGKVGEIMSERLSKRIERGDCCNDGK